MDAIRVRARVSGRVQGVFYRASTQERARDLGLLGWVRNCADGTVELEAQGPAEAVQELLEWCRKGPAGARVVTLDREEIELVEAEHGFQIRR